mgnify:CR=1 FL=1
MTTEVNADKLAAIWRKIRDKRLELEKEVDALKEQQDLVGGKILELCQEQGSTMIRTAHGTISVRTTKNYWTSDWDSVFQFIKEHDTFSLMQQRINNTNMKKFLEEYPDLLPPGLNSLSAYTVGVRKR